MSETQQQRYDRIDAEYDELFKSNKQLQYAANAVRLYLSEPVPRFVERDIHFRPRTGPLAPSDGDLNKDKDGKKRKKEEEEEENKKKKKKKKKEEEEEEEQDSNKDKEEEQARGQPQPQLQDQDQDQVQDQNRNGNGNENENEKGNGKKSKAKDKRKGRAGWRRGYLHNMKRHLLSVDDISRINYEVIKSTPGNVPAPMIIVRKDDVPSSLRDISDLSASLREKIDEINIRRRKNMLSEIDSIKTKMFKKNLFAVNDWYIKRMAAKVVQGSTDTKSNGTVLPSTENNNNNNNNSNSISNNGGDNGSNGTSIINEGNMDQAKDSMTTPDTDLTLEDDEPPLTEQIECLYEIQEKLIGQYKKLLRADEKWFVLRELLLDANVELDVFSEEDIKSTLAKKRSRRGNNKDQISQSEQNNEEPELDMNTVKYSGVKLGSINIPTPHTLSAIPSLSFNRAKRPDQRDIL